MGRTTHYFVQGFSEKRGDLKAEAPTRCKSEEAARRAVERLGDTKVGAVAFSSSGDSELGDYDEEPIVLAVLGRVPEQFVR
jgi:hypothetical protein